MTDSSPKEIEEIKKIARNKIPEIIDRGDNYFMCADFSVERITKTRDSFMSEVASSVSGRSLATIKTLHESLINNPENFNNAASTITSIASRLYWLSEESLRTPITEELMELISIIEPLGLETESHGFEWEQKWLDSESRWDQYIMSLMDGIDETPYLAFITITQMPYSLSYLKAWQLHLGIEKFSIISKFISTEAHYQLDVLNPEAALEIDRILDTFQLHGIS
ncbi:hypothetical protein ACIQUF_03395 [Pseudomonas sp. NPDC090233]|uniref:hypothetical protein n=1 Tax=Pseudomonas sp. NPDC090233 TaxID=3364479 RepID=UPI003839D847